MRARAEIREGKLYPLVSTFSTSEKMHILGAIGLQASFMTFHIWRFFFTVYGRAIGEILEEIMSCNPYFRTDDNQQTDSAQRLEQELIAYSKEYDDVRIFAFLLIVL